MLPLFIVAFVVPIIFVNNIFTEFSYDIIKLYSLINALGGLIFLIALFIGFKSKRIIITDGFKIFEDPLFIKNYEKIVVTFYKICLVGIIISFLVMGYVPMFADDPLQAKFFRGEYKQSYDKVKVIYRSSYFVIVTFLPLILAMFVKYRKSKYLILSFLGLCILILTLNRKPALIGLISFLFILFSNSRKRILSMLFIYTFITVFGTISYKYLYILMGKSIPNFYTGMFWEDIVRGSPDLPDQLNFLTHFERLNEPFTLGKTFIGGLIPNQFYWNPNVWTLSIANGGITDISNIVSGGIRLPVYIWGYVSFGWFGVVVITFLVGFFIGNTFRYFKYNFPKKNDIFYKTMVFVYFQMVYFELANFHLFLLYDLFVIFVLIMCVHLSRLFLRKRVAKCITDT
jgi:hypothetical protein